MQWDERNGGFSISEQTPVIEHKDHFHGSDLEKIEEIYGIKKEDITSFSANVNPLGISPKLKEALAEHIDVITSYPDREYTSLRKSIARYTHTDASHIIVGNGATELISLFIQIEHPKKALIIGPSYSEYEREIELGGGTALYYPLKEANDFALDVPHFLGKLNETIDLLVICNPNNPTGILTPRSLLDQILKKAEVCGILLVLDECFLDFTDQESQSLIPQAVKSQHLFILKSFTKMYAIPGIRLGYGISGNKELIEKMEKSGHCWNVSVLASEAGIAALQEVEYCEQARRLICREREKLKEGLKIFGFRVWNGQADYLFFQTPGITDLYERLLPYGILIRRCSNYRGLDKTHYRIAVKSPEANEKLLEVLRKVLTESYS